ncbi:MAG TPA: hypothetical protein DGB32_02815 [Dehalococcoidia bacterium]|jgi:hypothetical protein|nr:hypothetical protein [Chloroflexota bacterium]MDP5877432.1 hypothetical protein [Dehalococcoidia bacterium]MDP7213072.1 hypothetical protein [Dehalococcoidia bacterium]HCV27236.1 hypothetical protein [Dehalococcoidia bacterium]|tara:strand:+ start:677 stop:937 length:261 start_codon:yes stop_codon:yes gene_type:complete
MCARHSDVRGNRKLEPAYGAGKIYDDPVFFASYNRTRTHGIALAEALEEPAIRNLLTDLNDMNILDLGRGTGVMSHWVAEHRSDRP